MAFTLSGSTIQVSGNETGLTFIAWLGSNPTAGKQLTANTVEALFQLKIQNGAVFDTSNIALVINHRVEGQANATTDTGIWRCKGGVVIVQGSSNHLGDDWAIQDWENVQFYVQKTGGRQSFFGGNSRPTAGSVKNTKFIVKNGDIDAVLELTGGTGTLSNILMRNEGASTGIIGLRETGTSDIEMYRIEPFGWGAAPTTFHKNWKLYNSSNNELNYHYRRSNGGAIFYNAVNSFNGNRMTAIRYVDNGASGGDNARSVLVGAYSPKIIDISKTPMSRVEIAIFKTSDSSLEASGKTGSDGKIAIVNNSTNASEMSYNNTFNIGGTNYTRKIYDAGVKYIKQSITPTTTGGNVVSVDQGTFKIVQRRKDLQEIIVTQSFLSDYTGDVVVLTDAYYTTDQSANLADITFTTSGANITAMTINANMTLDRLHDITKAYLEANLQITNPFSESGTIKNCGAINITGVERITAGTKLTSLQSSGTLTANGAFSIEVIGTVNQDTPTNLPATAKATTLVYNTNTPISVSFSSGTTIGTVRNDGTATVTASGGSVTTYTDAEINYTDSKLSVADITSATIYGSQSDRDTGANPGATFTTSLDFKYGSVVSGVTMQNTIYLRVVVGSITLFSQITLVTGSNILDLGVQGQLSAINAKVDLTAKETTLLQTKADIITEVNDNETKIAAIKAKTDILVNTDISTLSKTDDLQKVNRNVIKASKSIPAGETF